MTCMMPRINTHRSSKALLDCLSLFRSVDRWDGDAGWPSLVLNLLISSTRWVGCPFVNFCESGN
jgi:hypothetical protein